MDLGTVLSAAQTLLAALECSDLKEALSILSYESEMVDLQRTVKGLTAILRDAETKQQLSNQTQEYIEQIKDVVFDADDLMDELLTLAHQQRIMDADGSRSLLEKVRHFFSKSNPIRVSYWMSRGIKDVKKKLDAVAKNKQFNIQFDHEPIRKRSRETCSYVDEAQIIGREHDLEYIVGTLLASHDKKSNNVSVLSIVGMGGLGKTALAQLMYKDPRDTNAFPLLKMWTCVSDEGQNELDVKNILAKDKLAEYLIGGERGSYIVVTTRSQKTATITGGQIHELPGLSKENSWSLFIRTAIDSKQSNSPDEELVRIGEKIVDGYAGVPLAIRVAGSLLYGQDKNKWMNIQQIGLANIRDKDNDIVLILELGFHHLETPLKNCFRYCALFPKDYEIQKEVLLRLWMAQGYIVPLDYGQSIENAAEEYFSILLKRCFFQDIKQNKHGEIESCKIHDLMNDIAQKMSENEIYASNTINGNIGKKVRHLSILNASQFERYYSSSGNTHIRSLLSVNTGYDYCELLVDDPVKSLKCLRALGLPGQIIKRLPDSIGELLHLRYIDLSNNHQLEVLPNSITKYIDLSNNHQLEVLPNSITKLCNLQFLILNCCFNLEELPKDLSRLVKLRVLDIQYCFKLSWMPRGMGKLTCFHTLKGEYTVRGEGRCKSWKQWLDELEDLKTLINLKGQLQIKIWWPDGDAKNDVKEDTFREGLYLRSLEHLDSLQFIFGRSYEEDEGIRMRVMEALQPHFNLKRLLVRWYDGVKMPGWLTLLPNLVELTLQNCPELKYLSCLGNLCHLKFLFLDKMPNLEYIIIKEDIKELASTSAEKISFYPSLQILSLSFLPKLKGWRRGVELEKRSNNNINPQIMQLSLPQLKDLMIENCREFTCNLLCCPMLETLDLRGFNEGMQIECIKTRGDMKSSEEAAIENPGSTHHVPKLRNLKVSSGARFDSMPMESFQCLQVLCIFGDEEMVELPRCLQCSSALQTLLIGNCKNLKAMPNWMPKLTSLKHLYFVRCSESLGERCQKDPPGEDWPLIQHIPNIAIPPVTFSCEQLNITCLLSLLQ